MGVGNFDLVVVINFNVFLNSFNDSASYFEAKLEFLKKLIKILKRKNCKRRNEGLIPISKGRVHKG